MENTEKGLMEEMMNSLLQVTFQMNSHSDNCAYWLAFNNFINSEKIFHEKYAHKFPEWADSISDLMLKLGMQPIRKSLEDNDYDYSDYVELFEDVETELDHYRQIIYRTIDVANTHNIRELVGFLDAFLLELIDYKKQTKIWFKKAEENLNDSLKFDQHFESFTFI